MQTITTTTSDGIARTVEGKLFPNEFRVYRVHGDVTNRDALAELAQILALSLKVERVTLSI